VRTSLSGAPALRRFVWYARQIATNVDRRFFLAIVPAVVAMVLVSAVIVTVVEKPITVESFAASINWGLLAVVGRAPAGYVATAIGWLVYWILVLFGVGIVGTITAAIVGIVINFLLKEGQGMGVSGFRDHVIVCGWNQTARDLINELRLDDRKVRIALIHNGDRNPAGPSVYYVKGEPTNAGDLERAGIREAASAVVFPLESSSDADMKSILVAMTIRSLAPWVRVVAEVNDPIHVDHFRRAGADELLVTSHVASRLLARSAVYPGLTDVIQDLVSSGGSELFTVSVPEGCAGLDWDKAAYRFRTEYAATFTAVIRTGRTMFSPTPDFTLRPDDEVVVIANELGRLVPSATATNVAHPPVKRAVTVVAPEPIKTAVAEAQGPQQ